ncbi:MAG TPA: MerR family transcriptional regulator [Xanthobacteraceae bacterium]|nr:MerR family transcriptional regulator [Xanthobacteraceae bacterium]
MEKGPDAFRTISEVAEDLDLPQHVLRFWETRFGQIKPLKRGGGRRYYRPDDIDLLRGIRHLLYGEGYTIRGVQQILREQGLRHVQAIGQSAAEEAARTGTDAAHHRGGEASRVSGLMDLLPSLRGTPKTPELPRVVEVPVPSHQGELDGEREQLPQFLRKADAAAPAVSPAADRDGVSTTKGDAVLDGAAAKLAPDAVQLLKAALNELGECKRMLDTVREREW